MPLGPRRTTRGEPRPPLAPLGPGLATVERLHRSLEALLNHPRRPARVVVVLLARLCDAMPGRFKAVSRNGLGDVHRNESELPATLLPMRAAPFPRQEIIERGQKEPAELPLATIRQTKMIFGDQLSKELLRQILRLLRSVPFPAHIRIDGIPIGMAKRFQRALCRG